VNHKYNYYGEKRSETEESEMSSAMTHFCEVLDSNEGQIGITRMHIARIHILNMLTYTFE